MDFIIDPELKIFTDISPKCRERLVESLLNEGLRDVITYWPRDNQNVIVDGMTRYEICREHKIEMPADKFVKTHFNDIEECVDWMLKNQRARRELMEKWERCESALRAKPYIAVIGKRRMARHGQVDSTQPEGAGKKGGKASKSRPFNTMQFLSDEFDVGVSLLKQYERLRAEHPAALVEIRSNKLKINGAYKKYIKVTPGPKHDVDEETTAPEQPQRQASTSVLEEGEAVTCSDGNWEFFSDERELRLHLKEGKAVGSIIVIDLTDTDGKIGFVVFNRELEALTIQKISCARIDVEDNIRTILKQS